MRILVCPSGFRGSISPHTAADCIQDGILRAMPTTSVRKVPMADGGEGFAYALVTATEGHICPLQILGPARTPIPSFYGVLGGKGLKTAVVEIAAAAGLSLVPFDCRNPCVTTSFGVGQLIAAALDDGVERIIVGCGDSGVSDGGVGMLQALGARFLDRDGKELPIASGGQSLLSLAKIDAGGLHPGLQAVDIEVACNWKNVLCGPLGVARVYGPQKGATPEQTELLAASLDTFALVAKQSIGVEVSNAPGSGASGGLGAAFMLLGATLRPRYEAIMQYFNIADLFDKCDLVFTAEGGIDDQTPRGKIPAEVAMRAKQHGRPVIVLAGSIGNDARVNYEVGINAYASILQRPSTLDEAIVETERLLAESAEAAMRMVVISHDQMGLVGPDDNRNCMGSGEYRRLAEAE
ncbi:glycerate kinase [Aspergillus steynii IBT 23096]|uniref:Glycerate kinase n=1 Tax=Aspergillus steynii IBT 23096 TaxID=1392250 RepID=A0A2I2G3H0_9EURO|nr:glycerate kinase [Aspergillus steynii IBT 23096]PLB47428.1 glycerate kinase [Aspergillus steynii IBT 23096]